VSQAAEGCPASTVAVYLAWATTRGMQVVKAELVMAAVLQRRLIPSSAATAELQRKSAKKGRAA
jgi:hypothetical protein